MPQSMLTLIDIGIAREAFPSYWNLRFAWFAFAISHVRGRCLGVNFWPVDSRSAARQRDAIIGAKHGVAIMDVDVVIVDAERVMNKALDADGVEPTIYYVGQSLAMLNAAILREINGLRRDIERLRAIA